MTPFLVVGDFPGQPTGLSRILTDLLDRITGHFADRFEVGVCGYAPRWEGLPTTGTHVTQAGATGRAWAFNDIRQWGAPAIQTCYRSWYGNRPGIIFTVWDPGRCYELVRVAKEKGTRNLPVELWGYFAIDSENVNGTISGPAAETIKAYDRVLAYTRYGAEVIAKLEHTDDQPWLYHGIDLTLWHPDGPMADRLTGRPVDGHVIGCVATNQDRKDLGLVFGAVKALRERYGIDATLWLHVDRPMGQSWSVPQLAEDFGLLDHLAVTTTLTDDELAACYRSCTATIAPGRGEGFGYPIVESLACGTPCVHVDFAGGAELTPPPYRIDPICHHLVGPYAVKRPILAPADVAARLHQIILAYSRAGMRQWAEKLEIDWDTQLWPKWQRWIEEGLRAKTETV